MASYVNPSDKRTFISKSKFCEITHTSPNCWMFKEGNWEKRKFFYLHHAYDDQIYYYYDNGADKIRRFKVMPEYNEVWMSFADRNSRDYRDGYSIWTTWTTY